MRRRILVQAPLGLGLLTIFMVLTAPKAYADNCGSLYDCFGTSSSAASVTAGIAVIISIAVLALPPLLNNSKRTEPEPPVLPQQPQVSRSDPQIPIARPSDQLQALRPEKPAPVPSDPPVKSLVGIHHVTAIAGNPQQNVEFYTNVLGLRLVKLTINNDNPNTYHLYYGDEQGRPGTILSFFAWPSAIRGNKGSGQAIAVALSVPEGTLNYWADALSRRSIRVTQPATRFDEQMFSFSDPDGLQIDMVAHRDTSVYPAQNAGPIPPEYAIRGIYGVTLLEANYEHTHAFLTEVLGFRQVQTGRNYIRYEVGNGGPGTFLDVLVSPSTPPSQFAPGIIHHLAWHTPEDEQRQALQENLTSRGISLTQGMDPPYFPAYSFREPGGVLFEIAEKEPGFTVDEPAEQLGTHLMLPPWLAHRHAEIQQGLPPLRLPFTGR